MELNEFYKKITNWLGPLGYHETFSNHPLLPIREFHFIKDRVRVVCVNEQEPYFYLYVDVMELEYVLGLKSARYKLEDHTFDNLIEFIKSRYFKLIEN